MNSSKLKNMIVIKDLPSNIIEEAYVVLKPNMKYNKKIENLKNKEKEESPIYIVKEAEMVISNYLSDLENNKKLRNMEAEKIRKKYEKSKKICLIFGGIILLNLIANYLLYI